MPICPVCMSPRTRPYGPRRTVPSVAGKPTPGQSAAVARSLDGVLPLVAALPARPPLARVLSSYVDVVGNRSPIAIAGGWPSDAEASAL